MLQKDLPSGQYRVREAWDPKPYGCQWRTQSANEGTVRENQSAVRTSGFVGVNLRLSTSRICIVLHNKKLPDFPDLQNS
ncbi:hypothetical protein Caka_1489 [Coraliomargarita akajimensis DSM 45221]|uniref:Uncharacterized protein n=1 Tax=Coraliomargarita akajimensis (strain DSM 45221 / IAM 15411 / JCM 23193 / KCTC 12865 / 04OKA010-24) TaxID=583355 RepID=D5EJA9_CORAD|nr:hypothetical protein Caka_1489 [Coraliomargarita akajimensis DSM 45221]